jgi:hypothetical protein
MKPTPPLPPEVLDALRRGRTLEAIKLLRKSGFGLAEAKRLLEWQARQNTIPTRARPAEEGAAPESIPRSMAPPRPMAHPHQPAATQASIVRRLSPGEVPRGGGSGIGVGVLLVAGILAALYFLGVD